MARLVERAMFGEAHSWLLLTHARCRRGRMDSLADRLHKFGLAFERKRPPTLLQRRIVFHFGYQLFSGAGLSFLLRKNGEAMLTVASPSTVRLVWPPVMTDNANIIIYPHRIRTHRSGVQCGHFAHVRNETRCPEAVQAFRRRSVGRNIRLPCQT